MLTKWISWLYYDDDSLSRVFTLRMYTWITHGLTKRTSAVAQEVQRSLGDLFNLYIEMIRKQMNKR